jgi:hypothetical protein
MQTVERVPIVALPRPEPVVQREMQQSQHYLINLVCVDLHICVPNQIGDGR